LSRERTVHSSFSWITSKGALSRNDAVAESQLEQTSRTRIPIENPARILPGATSMDSPAAIFSLAVRQVLDLRRKK
jgi:hypothetical protein